MLLAGLTSGAVVANARAAAGATPDAFAPTIVRTKNPPARQAPAGMVWIPESEFSMGCLDPTTDVCGGNEPMFDARPIHRVQVSGFWMDATAVTLCRDNKLPIRVFALAKRGNVQRVVQGEDVGTLVTETGE